MSNHEKKKTPFFSVVIPTYERPDDLRRCLNALKPINQPHSPAYETIVTDDSKSDSSRVIVKKEFPEVKWRMGKKNGPGGNRNAGVSEAKGEWIVFIDDDCIAQKGYLVAYSKAIEGNPNVDLFEGYIFPDRPKRTWAETCPENSFGGMFWTSNLCVRKRTFNELGGFDETFQVAYEDVDFAFRIQKEGKKTLFVKNAGACHPWRTLKNEGNNWKPKGFEWKELELFIKKHPEAHEHSSPQIYAQHFLRMVSKDLYHCVTKFRGRGLSVLLGQTFVTSCVIFRLMKIKLFA
jgi:GT2 family glycosyltransferase